MGAILLIWVRDWIPIAIDYREVTLSWHLVNPRLAAFTLGMHSIHHTHVRTNKTR